ncbi:hypothetical protein HK098_001071 [Nowakowskiella sp. JEL0407]|nr:hypothetical protein HK098_001071 [Nowakowskiella sp. JEL0407]
MDAFQLVANRNRDNPQQKIYQQQSTLRPPHSQYEPKQQWSWQTAIPSTSTTSVNTIVKSPSLGSLRSSGSGSASRKAKDFRITRLVSLMVHLIILDVPTPETADSWQIYAEEMNARPSQSLYAFTHRILTSHKWALPFVMITLKYLERYHKNRKAKEKLNSQMLLDEAFNRMEVGQLAESPAGKISEYGLLTAAFMVANKFLDDNRFSNKWWAKVTDIPIGQLNVIEVMFLREIEFSLHIRTNEYMEWVNAMQSFSKRFGQNEERMTNVNHFGLNHLNTSNGTGSAGTHHHSSIQFHSSSPKVGISPSPSITSISSAATCFTTSTPFDKPKFPETFEVKTGHHTNSTTPLSWAVFSSNDLT